MDGRGKKVIWGISRSSRIDSIIIRPSNVNRTLDVERKGLSTIPEFSVKEQVPVKVSGHFGFSCPVIDSSIG